jgi:hypothetical protein
LLFQNVLNCDPTYELEEMIIEAKPLQKKRLLRQQTLLTQHPSGDKLSSILEVIRGMLLTGCRAYGENKGLARTPKVSASPIEI